jgi:probable HAF family extracellular repeat protein
MLAVVVAFPLNVRGAAYSLIELKDLPGGGNQTVPVSINNLGQMAGAGLLDNTRQGLLWSSGSLVRLGDLPGGAEHSTAVGINDSGQVAGSSHSDQGNRAFIWQNGLMTDLGAIPSESEYAQARGINSRGEIVGVSDTSDASIELRAVKWSASGAIEVLAEVPESSESAAAAINDYGQIVGASWTTAGHRPTLWNGNDVELLNTLPGMPRGEAKAINNASQIVGYSTGGPMSTRATMWMDGDTIDLGELAGGSGYSDAYGINDLGQVVGLSSVDPHSPGNGLSAFLWENGTMYDLNDLIDPSVGWILTEAFDINNSGQIAGRGIRPDGTRGPFMLTPVPEPNAGGLAVLSSMVLILARRKSMRTFRLRRRAAACSAS